MKLQAVLNTTRRSSTMVLVLALGILAAWPLVLFAQDDETPPASSPLPFEISITDESLADLDADQRDIVAQLKTLLEKHLIQLPDPEFTAPPTLMPEGPGELIEWSDLVQPLPDDSEVAELAHPTRRLDASQLGELRETGTFVVPSLKYPGQNHVWQVSAWIQKGRKGIEATWTRNRKDGRHLLTIAVPDTLFGSKGVLTMRRGLRNVAEGLSQAWALVVGRSELEPKYSDAQVRAMVREEIYQHARQHSENLPSGALLTLDQDLMSKAEGPLENSLLDFEHQWKGTRQKLRADLESKWEIETRGKPIAEDSEALQTFTDMYEDGEKMEALAKWLAADEKLNAIHPELGAAIGRKIRATRLVLAEEALFLDRLYKEFSSAHVEQIRDFDRHSEDVAREKALQQSLKDFWLAALPGHFARVVRMLENADLQDEAAQFEALALAAETHFATRTLELSALQAPMKTFRIESPIWRRSKWNVKKDTFSGRYVLETTTTKEVPTVGPWRLKLLGERIKATPGKLMHSIWIEGFWRGTLGLQALFRNKPFPKSWVADPASGRLIVMSEGGTLLEAIRNQYRIRARLIDQHRQERPTGLFGKHFERLLLIARADLFHGALAPLLIATVQPALTVLNLGMQTAVTAVAVPLSPAAVVLGTAWNVLIKDRDRVSHDTPRVVPLFQSLIVKSAICGIGQCVGAVAKAGVAGVAGVALYAGGEVHMVVRTGWDAMMHNIVAKWGRIPGRDASGFVHRTQGPDISNSFGYRMSVELATLLAWAEIEAMQWRTFLKEHDARLKAPTEKLNEVASALEPLLGTTDLQESKAVGTPIQERVARHLKALQDFVNQNVSAQGLFDGIGQKDPSLKDALREVYFTEADLAEIKRRLTFMIEEHPVGKGIAVRAWSKDGKSELTPAQRDKLIRAALEGATHPGIFELTVESLRPSRQGGLVLRIREPGVAAIFANMFAGQVSSDQPTVQPQLPSVDPAPVTTEPKRKQRQQLQVMDATQICQEALMDPARTEPQLWRVWRTME